MTLDEYIEHFNLVVVYAKRGGEYAANFSDLDNLIDFNTGVLGYLKELKALRVELEKNSKELGVYKKALELTAEDYTLGIRIRVMSANQYIEHYLELARAKLQKLRGEDDGLK